MNKQSRCPHYPNCIGCCLTDVGEAKLFNDAQNYFKEKEIALPPLQQGASVHWRTRAKLAVRGTAKNPLIGLYKEGTHAVLDISECIAHHPQINAAIAQIKAWMKEQEIAPYDETTYRGALRYIQLAVERSSGRVQLVLVLNEPLPDVKRLYTPALFHSLWINKNTRKDNVIFGKEWELVVGERFLWEQFLGIEVAFLPQSFAQANPDLFTRLLASLKKQIEPNTRLIEYYAGAGVIGLVLSDICESIICSEIVPDGKECFDASLKKLAPFHGEKLTYKTGSAAELLDLLPSGNAVLVDPPRKGIDPKLLNALKVSQAKTLFYISCGWDSFKRDCDQLLEAGWKFQAAEAFLFFPGSAHLETLAILKKP